MTDRDSLQDTGPQPIPRVQRVISVLWPSFLTAGLATTLFFTAFDPVDLSMQLGGFEISRLAGYSIGFFLFWLLTATSCGLTCFFQKPCKPKHYPRRSTPDEPL